VTSAAAFSEGILSISFAEENSSGGFEAVSDA
jgi:hypothetical protein